MQAQGNTNGSRFVWRIVDGEALIVDLQSGGFFALDRVGTEVWSGLKDGREVAQIVAAIAAKYEVDATMVRRDVDELLADLAREGLLD